MKCIAEVGMEDVALKVVGFEEELPSAACLVHWGRPDSPDPARLGLSGLLQVGVPKASPGPFLSALSGKEGLGICEPESNS